MCITVYANICIANERAAVTGGIQELMASNENGRYTLAIVIVILMYCICVVDEQAAVNDDDMQEVMGSNDKWYSYIYNYIGIVTVVYVQQVDVLTCRNHIPM